MYTLYLLTKPPCQQVPKRIYSLEELRLNKIEAERFLSPADETLNTVRTVLQVSLLLVQAEVAQSHSAGENGTAPVLI